MKRHHLPFPRQTPPSTSFLHACVAAHEASGALPFDCPLAPPAGLDALAARRSRSFGHSILQCVSEPHTWHEYPAGGFLAGVFAPPAEVVDFAVLVVPASETALGVFPGSLPVL